MYFLEKQSDIISDNVLMAADRSNMTEVRLDTGDTYHPENIVRVTPTTRSLIKHLKEANDLQTMGNILSQVREEHQNVTQDQLINSWLTFFEDSLKADAIFLKALPS
jgi:hypothetical protein